MGDSTIRHTRRQFRWNKDARELVMAHVRGEGLPVHELLDRLAEVSGNPRQACLRFARGLGVKPKCTRRPWTPEEEQRLLRLLESRPVTDIAVCFRRSVPAVYAKIWKLGANASIPSDSFTVYSLAAALQLSRDSVQSWITKGLLQTEMHGARLTITADEFITFCKKHPRLVLGRRLDQERLEFIRRFVFAPRHAELLPVRDSKRERAAYAARTGTEDPEGFPPSKITNTDVEETRLEMSA